VILRSGRLMKLLALLVALMMVGAACGGDDDDNGATGTTAADDGDDDGEGGDPEPGPGFDGTTIRLGVVTPQTGIAAVIGNPLTNGNRVFFERLNAEGGIAGRYPVELDIVDSQYQSQTGVQQYNSIKNNVAMFVQLLGTPIVNAILPLLETDNIVASPASLDSFWVEEQNLLALGAPYQIQAINAMDWWINQEGNEDSTICVMHQDDPYGEAGLEGIEFAGEQFDFEITRAVTFGATDTEFGAQVGQLRGDGCEMVFLVSLPSHTGAIMGEAAQTGFTPQWIGQSPTWIGLLAGTAAGEYMAENFVVVLEGPEWGDTSSEGMAQMIEDLEQYAPDQSPDIYFAFGYAQAWATAQVLERAVERGDLSREGIIEAMNTVGTIDLGGILGDYEYGPPEDRKPPRASHIQRVDPGSPDTGNLVSLTGVFESDAAKEFEFSD
jgi:ABC-type branched-subunit amino acid transport system substrate-binding protein